MAATLSIGGGDIYEGVIEGGTAEIGLLIDSDRRGRVSKDRVRRQELRTVVYVPAILGSCVLV